MEEKKGWGEQIRAAAEAAKAKRLAERAAVTAEITKVTLKKDEKSIATHAADWRKDRYVERGDQTDLADQGLLDQDQW